MGYNSVCVKDMCQFFCVYRRFWRWAIECCKLNATPIDPLCHGNEIWDKMGYNEACIRDVSKIFASNRGSVRDWLLDKTNLILQRPTRVAMETTVVEFGQKLI